MNLNQSERQKQKKGKPEISLIWTVLAAQSNMEVMWQ